MKRHITTPDRPPPPLPSGRGGRAAFTLIELLAAVAIIGILTTLSLGAMYAAGEQAKAARTRSLVARLNDQLLPRWEALRTRRLPIDAAAGLATDDPQYAQKLAVRQLLARRRLARMELPDKWADVAWDVKPYDSAPYALASAKANPRLGNPFWNSLTGGAEHVLPVVPPGSETDADVPLARTALSETYRRYFTHPSRYDCSDADSANWRFPSARFEGAECLYMILTTAVSEENFGSDRFQPSEVGDVDGDGAPEFLDGWGNPIEFIRWPAGFVSEMQPLEIFGETTFTTITSNLAQGYDPFRGLSIDELANHRPESHDPFDPLRVDPLAFRLIPLIYSAGPDGRQPGGYGLEIHRPTAPANLKSEDLNDPYDRLNLPDTEIDDDSASWEAENGAADLGDGSSGTGTGRMRGAPRPELRAWESKDFWETNLKNKPKRWSYRHRDNIHSHALQTP